MHFSSTSANTSDLSIFWNHHVPALLTIGHDTTLRDLNAVAVFQLTGREPSDWTIRLQHGFVESVEPGAAPSPSARIRLDSDEFLRIARGESDHREAFFAGKINVEGNVETVLRTAEWIPVLTQRFPFDPNAYRCSR